MPARLLSVPPLTVASIAAPSSPSPLVSSSSVSSALLLASTAQSCEAPSGPMPFLLKSAATQLPDGRAASEDAGESKP